MKQSKKLLKRIAKITKQNIQFEPYDSNDLDIRNYLMSFFKGKAGWKYVSISKPGSVFTDVNGKNIVPIMLHKEVPSLTNTGKYTSEHVLVVKCVKIHEYYKDFQGLVFDKKGIGYAGTSVSAANNNLDAAFIPPAPVSLIMSEPNTLFNEITAEEFDSASTIYMKKLAETVEATNEKFKNMSKFFKSEELENSDPALKKELQSLEKQFAKIDMTNEENIAQSLNTIKNTSSIILNAAEESKETIDQLKELVDVIKE